MLQWDVVSIKTIFNWTINFDYGYNDGQLDFWFIRQNHGLLDILSFFIINIYKWIIGVIVHFNFSN
jgi:hypothetical protein